MKIKWVNACEALKVVPDTWWEVKKISWYYYYYNYYYVPGSNSFKSDKNPVRCEFLPSLQETLIPNSSINCKSSTNINVNNISDAS